MLNSLRLGQRFFIVFYPEPKVTRDFAKIPGAGADANPLNCKP
jgi:hypothetical protein